MPRKDLVSYSAKVGYRKHPGMVMWLFHRVSGVVIGLFLIFHILGISGICSFMGDVVKMPVVIDIIAALFVFHVANGIRIMVMEFVSEKTRQGIAGTLIVVGICVAMLLFRLVATIGNTGA